MAPGLLSLLKYQAMAKQPMAKQPMAKQPLAKPIVAGLGPVEVHRHRSPIHHRYMHVIIR